MIKIQNWNYLVTSNQWVFGHSKFSFTLKIPFLEIKQGEILGIYGRNGSGKTTLVETLTGSRALQEGSIEINDQEPLFSAVFQDSAFDDVPIISTLKFFNKANGNLANLEKLLIDFELLDSCSTKFNSLSFGQKQRFRLVVALLKPFSILVLDEITTGIDARWKRLINDLLQDVVKRNKTVIMISHNEDEIIRFCDRVLYLEKGKIIDDFPLLGTAEEKRATFLSKVDYVNPESEEDQEWTDIL